MHPISFNALLSRKTGSGIHQQLVRGLFTPSCLAQGDYRHISKRKEEKSNTPVNLLKKPKASIYVGIGEIYF